MLALNEYELLLKITFYMPTAQTCRPAKDTHARTHIHIQTHTDTDTHTNIHTDTHEHERVTQTCTRACVAVEIS